MKNTIDFIDLKAYITAPERGLYVGDVVFPSEEYRLSTNTFKDWIRTDFAVIVGFEDDIIHIESYNTCWVCLITPVFAPSCRILDMCYNCDYGEQLERN